MADLGMLALQLQCNTAPAPGPAEQQQQQASALESAQSAVLATLSSYSNVSRSALPPSSLSSPAWAVGAAAGRLAPVAQMLQACFGNASRSSNDLLQVGPGARPTGLSLGFQGRGAGSRRRRAFCTGHAGTTMMTCFRWAGACGPRSCLLKGSGTAGSGGGVDACLRADACVKRSWSGLRQAGGTGRGAGGEEAGRGLLGRAWFDRSLCVFGTERACLQVNGTTLALPASKAATTATTTHLRLPLVAPSCPSARPTPQSSYLAVPPTNMQLVRVEPVGSGPGNASSNSSSPWFGSASGSGAANISGGSGGKPVLLDTGTAFLVQAQLYNGLGQPVQVSVYSYTVTVSLVPELPELNASAVAGPWADSTIATLDPGPSSSLTVDANSGVVRWSRLLALGWPGRYRLRFDVGGASAAEFKASEVAGGRAGGRAAVCMDALRGLWG